MWIFSTTNHTFHSIEFLKNYWMLLLNTLYTIVNHNITKFRINTQSIWHGYLNRDWH